MAPSYENDKAVSERTHLLDENEAELDILDIHSRHPKKPSIGRKIAVMMSCILLQIICGGVGYGLAVMYAELIVVFDAKRADAALVQTLFMGINTGGGILWTGVVRRLGPGVCTVIGTLVGCGGLLASSFAASLTTIIITTGAVASAGLAVCYLVPFITVSWVFHDDPGLPLVILTLGTSMGQFILPFIYEKSIEEYQWSGSFMVISGVALHCVPCGLIIYHSRDYFFTGIDRHRSDNEVPKKKSTCDMSLLKDVLIYFILIIYFLTSSTGNQESWFLVDIMTSRGYEREQGSLLVSVIGFSNLSGRVIGALIKTKCKYPTINHYIYLLPIIAAIHVLVINVFDFPLLIGACISYGVTFGVIAAQGPAIMFEAAGLEHFPTGAALMNLMNGIGNICGGLLGGSIKDTYGDYDLSFYIAAGASIYVALSSLIIACVVYRRKRKDECEPEIFTSNSIHYSQIEIEIKK